MPLPPTTVAAGALDRMAGRCWPAPPHTGRPSSVGWGQCSFPLGPGTPKVLFGPPSASFPWYCGSSVFKFCWLSKSDSLGIPVPLPDPQLGKSNVGPGTFAAVWELLCKDYSPAGGSPGASMVGLQATFLLSMYTHIYIYIVWFLTLSFNFYYFWTSSFVLLFLIYCLSLLSFSFKIPLYDLWPLF